MKEIRFFYDEVSKEYIELNKRGKDVSFAFYGELKKHYVKLSEEDIQRLKRVVNSL